MAFYLLAASHSLAGHEQKALKALGTSVENGFSRLELIENSEAFDPLRNEKKYHELISRIKSPE